MSFSESLDFTLLLEIIWLLRAYCPNVYTVPISAVDPNINEKYIANIDNTKNMTINVVSGMPNALPMGMRFIPLSVTVCNDL